MSLFYFYNNRKPRKFNHTPILYNPEEEARKANLEKRIREIKREMNVEVEAEPLKKKELKAEFVSQTKHLKKRMDRKESGETPFFTNNILLVLILVVLVAILFVWILR